MRTSSIIIKNKHPKVVVIGAGLAGLTTAYRLQKEGINVQLYEARNRVGGRVLTVKLNNQIVELGAQTFTNPAKHLHLCRLIKEFDLETIENQSALNYSYFNGENFTPVSHLLKNSQFEQKALRNKLIQLSSTSSNMKEVLEQLIGKSNPLFKVMAIKLAIYEGAAIEKLSTRSIKTLFHFLTDALSLQSEDTVINRLSIKGGNGMLPEKMAYFLGSRLRLNQRLVEISKDNDVFVLTFENGQKAQADRVVLALPCSVYKSIDFKESVISSKKLKVINSVKYGTNSKILIHCPNAHEKSIGLVTDQIYSNFDYVRGVLTIHFTDEKASCLKEKFTNTYDLARPMIERMFTHLPSSIPLCAEDRSFVRYNNSISYSWQNDHFAQGSYSYISPGQEDALMSTTEGNGEKFKTLFAPIHSLYFAGEHASISEVPGTMEAACESGERIARTILKQMHMH